MRILHTEKLTLALNFIEHNGRSIDRALANFHFRDGDRRAVISALGDWRNEDGGFGHGLEQDFRSPSSSSTATSMALQILADVGVEHDNSLAGPALDFLALSRDKVLDAWPATPVDVNDYPHAPWWHFDDEKFSTDSLVLNPGAEIVGYFIRWGRGDEAAVETWLTHTVSALEERQSLEPHEILCCARLLEAPGLDPENRNRFAIAMERFVASCVELDSQLWTGYCIKPLTASPTPTSPLAPYVEQVVPEQVAFEIERQGSDGSWRPHWTWMGNYPEEWDKVEPEIAASITLDMLRCLKAWGATG